VFGVGILGLFVLDRNKEARPSHALWLPVIWVSLAASRMASQWFGVDSVITSADQALEGNSLDRNILMGLMAIGVIVLLRRGRAVGSLLRANAPIIVFFFYCAVSILWSDFPDVAFKRWTKALGDFVMLLVVLTDAERTAAIKHLLARVGFLLVPTSVLFIKYYPKLGVGYNQWEGTTHNLGVTTNKNLLGVVCLIAGLGCTWRLIEAFRGREGARHAGPLSAQITMSAMVFWLFVKAHSTTSMACFGLGAAVMVATSIPAVARKRALIHLLVITLAGTAYAALFLDVGLVETLGKDPTLTGRAALWAQILTMNEHPLFGNGFESFWLGKRLEVLWATYWWRPNEAHNGYLEVFLNLGWMGITLLAIVIATGYRNGLRLLSRDPETASIRLAFFLAGIVYSFTEAGFRLLNPMWFTFMLAAVAVPNTPVPKIRVAEDSTATAVTPVGPPAESLRRRVPVSQRTAQQFRANQRSPRHFPAVPNNRKSASPKSARKA